MSKITLIKKENIEEAQVFLDGGIIGANAGPGIEGLVDKTLVFTSPALATITFILGAGSNPYKLSFAEIKSQIEAGIPSVRVFSIGGKLVLVEVTPTNGVAISASGTANALLGFDQLAFGGRVIGPQGASPPYLGYLAVTADNRVILGISEV